MIDSLTNFWKWWIVEATPTILAWLTIPGAIIIIVVAFFLFVFSNLDWK